MKSDDAAVPTVVLVDDHRMFRTGVRTELGREVDIVGEAEDVDSAVTVILASRPDVVLLDVHLPRGKRPGGDQASGRTGTRDAVPGAVSV